MQLGVLLVEGKQTAHFLQILMRFMLHIVTLMYIYTQAKCLGRSFVVRIS